MSLLVKSAFVGLQSAPETTLGVLATANWRREQPNGGGLTDFFADLKKVARSPISVALQKEKSAVVGLGTAPKITFDLTKEHVEHFMEGTFRAATKYPGGTGTGRFTPSAVTATGYTVTAGGGLPNGVIVWVRGWANPANNGLKVLAGTSTNLEIKTTGLVVEGAPPVGSVPTIEVVGYQGAATDIAVNASGQLTSAANVFTTIGLNVGAWIWVGGGTAAAPGALGFTVAPQNRGFARITSIAAGVLGVDRKNQVWGTDPGTGKTIQIFFGPWLRNVYGDSVDYKEQGYSLEISFPGAAAAGATSYGYALGSCVNTFEVNAPSEEKVIGAISFVGTDFTDPTTVRATGANASPTPIQTSAFTTASEVRRLRVSNTDETGISTDILDWKLTINNNVKATPKQGKLGAAFVIFGNFEAMLDVTCIFTQDDVIKAIRDNRTCAFDVALASSDGVVLYDVPSVTLDDGAPDIQLNEAVTLPVTVDGFRDPTYNFSCGMTLFPYLPPN